MKRTVLSLVFISLLACQSKEEIIPIAEKEEISFNLSLPISSIDVDYQFSEIQEIDDIGGVFRELAELIANAEINQGNLGKIAFTPCLYKLDQIETIDFDFIHSINLKSANFEIKSPLQGATFDFLKNASVYARFINNEDYAFLSKDYSDCAKGEKTSENDKQEIDYWNLDTSSFDLLMNYSEEKKSITSIRPTIYINEYKEKLIDSTYILLFFKVEVTKVPSFDFSIEGNLDLKIDIDLNDTD